MEDDNRIMALINRLIVGIFIVLFMMSIVGCNIQNNLVTRWMFDREVQRKQPCMDKLIKYTISTPEYKQVLEALNITRY
jgi:hypothetical protein